MSFCSLVSEKSVILVTYLHFFFFIFMDHLHGGRDPYRERQGWAYWWHGQYTQPPPENLILCSEVRVCCLCMCEEQLCFGPHGSLGMCPFPATCRHFNWVSIVGNKLRSSFCSIVLNIDCTTFVIKVASLYGQTFPVFVFFLCFLTWAWCDLVVSHRYLQAWQWAFCLLITNFLNP